MITCVHWPTLAVCQVRGKKMKNARALLVALSLFVVPKVFANPGSQSCREAARAPTCKAALPEPSAIPEFAVYLAMTGIGLLVWQRSRKTV